MYKQVPAWAFYLKVPYEEYNPTEHGVVGNFEAALQFLINYTKDKEGFYSPTLVEFDKIRGNDWYTTTRRELYGSHEEWCDDEGEV